MAWNSLKLIFLCILVCFCNFPTSAAQNPDMVYFGKENCSAIKTTENSTYAKNLRTLFSSLSSNATKTLFYNTTILDTNASDTVYGMFMCRGDIPFRLCNECVANATENLSSDRNCSLSIEAVIWYAECTIRYSNVSFFSTVDTSDELSLYNPANVSPNSTTSFMNFLLDAMNQTAEEAANSSNKFSTKEANLSHSQSIYCLTQCSQDLSPQNCTNCLTHAISRIQSCCAAKQGVRVMYPSCNVWYEMYPFYGLITDQTPKGLVPPTTTASTPPSPGKGRSQTSETTIILIVASTTVVFAILLTVCCYLVRRKPRKNNKTILEENFGHETSTIESLQFNLAIIEAATNNFSDENKIGKGGFGEVYKGVLIDGKSVAVKRLSKYSKQGVTEFKNEVLLIAKLQHRNLVAFMGFCVNEEEKILIYEYLPNKSLDYFLFDTNLETLLSWSERHKIIGGIARGILYLHEYSRLKVIHRDLKPNNVLLDEDMNPKIADFGLAKIVEIDQQEGNTNRIIGTYGYMSPEYAMFGQFSEKSDVYSFGVMVLEIISGKKNIGTYEPHRVVNGVLDFVWRQWRDETPLNTIDPKLEENYSNNEVMKCIQIGLLCVQENPDTRPTMMTIVSYLNGHSVELQTPQEPTFSLNRRRSRDSIVAHESSSRRSANNTPSSINEMSISSTYPR